MQLSGSISAGKAGGPGGFTSFPSIKQGLRAYAHLLRNVYGDFIDQGDWRAMVYNYAPLRKTTRTCMPKLSSIYGRFPPAPRSLDRGNHFSSRGPGAQAAESDFFSNRSTRAFKSTISSPK